MMNVVATGSKTVEMFQIEELTAEAFEKGMKEAGWEYEGQDIVHKTVVKYANGYEMEQVDARVSAYNVCVEMEMKYSQYKTDYAGCKTKKDSYNKERKTIVVYVQC